MTMNDAETRAELERINIEYALVWDDLLYYDRLGHGSKNTKISLRAYRLLAEKHKALREIKRLIDIGGDPSRCLDDIYGVVIDTLAKNACKGGK